ncbi:rhomboid family intramembrane serine protease [Candidatus Woesearchaeota archaeon]|nr:rhomboid family intramembrane serine protease [Candidatus Woesearchaeota archaeon]
MNKMKKIKKYKNLIFAVILLIIYVFVFFFVPESNEKLALNPEKTDEAWRFGTYQFAHLNLKHLVENLIGFSLLAVIAFELKTFFTEFSSTYLSSGLLSVLPMWLISPFTALGASNAIFGGFGLISQETKKYKINGWLIILLLTGLIFIKTIVNYFSYGAGSDDFIFAFKQGIAHFSGLMFGVGFFYFIKWAKPILTKKKREILRRSG